MDKRAIGVFDSGLGGLHALMPQENIIYFGDTGRVPYGTRGRDIITKYARQDVAFLRQYDLKSIIIACNTVSAIALDLLSKENDIPIIGTVEPACRRAMTMTQTGRVGVIGTAATIRSGAYEKYLHKKDGTLDLFTQACPLFVPLVEEGWTKDPITEEVARRYLAEILDKDIDTLIMGCTHYPLLRSLLRKVVGEKVTLVNPAYETSQALRRLLRELDLENPGNDELGRQKYQFFASDGVERFNAFAHSVLPEQISDTKQVQIENY